MNHHLIKEAEKLFDLLKKKNYQVVFAESCTGGLVAATLAGLPGISEYLCGSAVVYQIETKIAWLNVSGETIQKANVVSLQVAEEMAYQVLQKTAQATVAASITGHLGPNAPKELDGVVCIGIAHRNKKGVVENVAATKQKLVITKSNNLRQSRQQAAAEFVIKELCKFLEQK
ncbi:Molybdopterin binding motif, CinA N-terminal domain / C-terminal domain of CinA type S [hydrothermal vent metagenome]|uniref:Molybdopterin binding motif, CinA N-terminal domain / C-terminal domain of CinA type S n=1 Tax=hydrothermal vent metagenome TaxID=652676 RepID=A0A3B1DEJ5_9ZZZZ